MATDADARAAGFSTPAGTELISGGDDAIRQNARAAVDLHTLATRWQATPLTAGDVTEQPLGAYVVTDPVSVTGLPSGAPVGLLDRQDGVDEYTSLEYAATVWQRRRIDGLWRSWAVVSREIVKTHHLTRPLAASTETTTSRSVRIPFTVPAAARRVRVTIRNINYRTNTTYPGAVTLDTVAVGGGARDAAGTRTSSFAPVDGFPNGLRLLVSNASVPNMDAGWSSGWVNVEMTPGTDYMMSFGYRTNGQPIHLGMGGGWQTNGNPGNAGLINDATAAYAIRLPFDVRVELLTVEGVREDVVLGDSIAAGSNASFPVLEAPARIAALNSGRFTRLHTFGGAAMGEWIGANWGDAASIKWQEVTSAGRSDRAVIALGNNDIHAGTDLTTLKANFAALVALLRERVSANVIACTVTPRTAWVGTAKESVREAFNDWLRALPEGLSGVADTARAVEDATGHEPRADMVTSDGIHFNSAGSAALAGALASPRATPLDPAARLEALAQEIETHTHTSIENAPGSVVRLDSIGQLQHLVGGVVRTQFNTDGEMVRGTVPISRIPGLDASLYGSGPRRQTALLNGWTGDVRLEIVGRRVELVINGINGQNATSDVVFDLPAGATPSALNGTLRGALHWANTSGETAMYRYYVAGGSVRVTGGMGNSRTLYGEPLWYLTNDPAPTTPPWSAA